MRKTYYPSIKNLTSFFNDDEPAPTEEQQRILDAAASGNDLVVQAHPGAGKTATARMLSKSLDCRGYFLVFNRSARRDAMHRMGTVEVVTGHSLAFQQIVKGRIGYEQKLRWSQEHGKGDIPVPIIAREMGVTNTGFPGIGLSSLAIAVSLTIKAFLINDRTMIDAASVPERAVPASIRLSGDTVQQQAFLELVVQCSRTIWGRMADERDRFPITHDGYLKIFYLKQVQVSSQLWLLDEYQDTTPVQDAIIKNQEGQKIYIGDPYQQIYGWRGAIDAMERPLKTGSQRLYLSHSFRFNQTIADVANVLLASQGESVLITGEQAPFSHPNLNYHHTILVRNNLSMLGVVAEYLLRRQSVYIPGGLQREALVKAQSALALYRGRLNEVKVRGMHEIGSWGALKELATQGGPRNEYRELVGMIERYSNELPRVFKWAERSWDTISEDPGRVTIITAHKAKGREWRHLRLHDDLALEETVIEKLKNGDPLAPEEKESVNLLYVAITRAKKGLTLSREIKRNLGELNSKIGTPPAIKQINSDGEALKHASALQRTQEFIRQHGRRTRDG